MAQNTSHAVMQQAKDRKDTVGDFPTPPWATRAMVEHVLKPRYTGLSEMSVWEPSCNRGFMSRPLQECFLSVHSSDISDYGWDGQTMVFDFLRDLRFGGSPSPEVDWIISNPPFGLAREFIVKARQRARVGCAMLVRSAFLESSGRYNSLFKDTPPSIIAQYVERVPMVRGRYDPKASTATAYLWLIWERRGRRDPHFVWIPPCRAQFERESDFPAQVSA
jgi:hypothetical protein